MIRPAVTKRHDNPTKNKRSAYFSYFSPNTVLLRIARKERMQLNINENMANAVSSSIKVAAFISRIFLEVSTMKHNPSKFADVFKMWCEFEFLSFIFASDNKKADNKLPAFSGINN